MSEWVTAKETDKEMPKATKGNAHPKANRNDDFNARSKSI